MARPVPDSDPALSLVFFLGVKALLRRAAAERLQASSPKHATKGEEGGGLRILCLVWEVALVLSHFDSCLDGSELGDV